MDPILCPAPRPVRRKYSAEFKAQLIAACKQPGVSIAALAQANQINPNLLQCWVRGYRRRPPATAAAPETCAAFVPVTVVTPPVTAPTAIHLELRRGQSVLQVDWPSSQLDSCAAVLKELLR